MAYDVPVRPARRDDPWTAGPDGVGEHDGTPVPDAPRVSFEPDGNVDLS